MSNQIFQIQVGGIKCTNCAANIEKNLKLIENIIQVSVNVMQEKVQVVLPKIEEQKTEITINSVTQKINDLKFQVLSSPRKILLHNSDSENKSFRCIYVDFWNQNEDFQKIINILKEIPGVLEVRKQIQFGIKQNQKEHDKKGQLSITYDYEVTNGVKIEEQIKKFSEENLYSYAINDDIFLDNFKTNSIKNDNNQNKFYTAIILIVLFMTLSLIVPHGFPSLYDKLIYPKYPISIYTIVGIVLVLVTLQFYGIKIFKIAFVQWKSYSSYNMETLVSLGAISSLVMSVYLAILYCLKFDFKNSNDSVLEMQNMKIFSLFQTTGLILLIMYVGKYIEGIAKKSIVSMIDKILPPQNQLVQSNKVQYIVPKNRQLIIKEEKIVNVSLLNKLDIIRVLPKQKILIDGVVLKIEENSQNQKMEFFVSDSVNYGEDEARQLKVGDRISSGATIVRGSALIQVENALEDSILSKISLQLNQAQNSSNESQNNESITNILQQVSEYFVKGVILLSLTILFIWAVVIGFDLIDEQYLKHNVCVICIPFERAVSVMVASCPCVIGLAIPSVVAIALNLAMKHNIIIKNTSSFESINQVKSIIFDKTGTLFTQFDQVKESIFFNLEKQEELKELDQDKIWQIVYLLEKQFHHPIANILLKHSASLIKSPQNLDFYSENEAVFERHGIKGNLKDKQNDNRFQILIGSKNYQLENGIDQIQISEIEKKKLIQGTAIYLSINKVILLVILLDNEKSLRPEARQVVQYLTQQQKKNVYILSGDSKLSVKQLGQQLGISETFLYGECDQNQKQKIIQQIKKQNTLNYGKNNKVMMIGDGLNDILSLKEADVGVSINSKSELNLIACDVIMLNQNLWKLVTLFNLIKCSKLFIFINIFWACAYNVFIVILSSGMLYKYHIMIPPSVACISMSISSLIVVGFSNLLRLVNFENYSSDKKFQAKKINSKQMQKEINNKEYVQEMGNYQNGNSTLFNSNGHFQLIDEIEQKNSDQVLVINSQNQTVNNSIINRGNDNVSINFY